MAWTRLPSSATILRMPGESPAVHIESLSPSTLAAAQPQLAALLQACVHGGAQRFYETLACTYAGGIPGYALDPDGRPAKNAACYKVLGG
jgi:hypothetical protein